MTTIRAAASLTERAFQQIRADLLACRILPGERLKIADLCAQQSVSLGAVREALSRLVSDGLVVNEPQRGFRAAPISQTQLLDLTRVRIDVETLCLQRSLERGDLRWESELVAVAHELNRTPQYQDGDAQMLSDHWSQVHGRFHHAMVAGCDSPILLQMRQQLYDQSERYRRLSMPLAETDRDLVGEHTALLDAAVGRDVPRVSALIADHLNTTTSILIRASERGNTRLGLDASAA